MSVRAWRCQADQRGPGAIRVERSHGQPLGNASSGKVTGGAPAAAVVRVERSQGQPFGNASSGNATGCTIAAGGVGVERSQGQPLENASSGKLAAAVPLPGAPVGSAADATLGAVAALRVDPA